VDIDADQGLVSRPEVSWAQVTLLVPVRESSLPGTIPGAPAWQESVSKFPLSNEPGANTDQAWRSAHISPGARKTLYERRSAAALPDVVVLARMNRSDGRPITLATGNLEFLPTGILPGFGPGGILVVHAELGTPGPASPLPLRWLASAIKDLTRPAAGRLPGADGFVSTWGLTLCADPEIMVAVNAACPAVALRALRPTPDPGAGWDAFAHWTWALARGTVPSAGLLRTAGPPETPGRAIPLPRRLAIVDRAGIGILATDPADADPNVQRTLLEFVPVFQSLYTDVLLLGYLQLLVTAEVGARLDELEDPVGRPVEFHRLETRMRLLHNRFWRARITTWPWLNHILSAFQEENELPAVISQLSRNIRDSGEQIERSYQHGLNLVVLLLGALGFVGVVAGVFGSVAAFMTVFGTGRWGAVAGIIGTSAGVIVLVGGAALLLRRGTWRELSPFLRR
jgi:hypothetical protein